MIYTDQLLDERINKLLLEIGVKSGLKGKTYIREAIKCIFPDWFPTMGDIYDYIAAKYNVNSKSVERCIRFAIEDVFNDADTNTLKRFFGNMISMKSGKVSNLTFIKRCAEIIMEEE